MLWRKHPLGVIAFALALALTVFFAARLVVRTIYWANPAHHEQQIQGWMTVGYIARSWDIDPRALDALVGLPPPEVKGHPQPLSEIAKDRNLPVDTLIARVSAAIAQLQAKP